MILDSILISRTSYVLIGTALEGTITIHINDRTVGTGIALNVLGRYQDGNIWLGPNGLRNAPVKGEWPVSYHGTNIEFVHNIIKQGLRPGPSARFGIGIYSSPIIEMIERMGYAKAFKHNGKVYKVALQNRVDPDHLQIIPAVFTGTGADYWLSKSGGIRPYGVLIKEVAIGC